jgi:hypothetical protein
MYNVNFKTDQGLYDKFRITCTINKEKFQDVLTKLIENYVKENEKLIENPEIQKKIQPELPAFFGKPNDWLRYVRKLDRNGFENMVIRVNFHRILLHEYTSNRSGDLELKMALSSLKQFQQSEDYKCVKGGILGIVQHDYHLLR